MNILTSNSMDELRLFKKSIWDEIKVDPKLVEELREQVFDFAINNPDRIDLEDLCYRLKPPAKHATTLLHFKFRQAKIVVHDWMLKRWIILTRYNMKKALESCISCFEFRNFHQIKLLNDPHTVLPREFYRSSPLWIDSYDRKGNQIMIIRANCYRKISKFDEIVKYTMLHLIETFDQLFEEKPFHGLKLVLDMRDYNFLRDGNLDLTQFIVTTLARYSGLFEQIILYELPWTLSFIFGLAKKWLFWLTGLQEYNIVQMTHKQFLEIVDPEQLPQFIESGKKSLEQPCPDEALPLVEMVKSSRFYQVPDKSIKAILALFEEVAVPKF